MRNPKQHRMYTNPVLEFLATTGPAITLMFHSGIIILMVYAGYAQDIADISVFTVSACILGGIVFWTLAEYLLHRFIFHLEGKSRAMKAIHYALHGYHHLHPDDANRLFMPPFPATIILSLFFTLFYLIMQEYAFFFTPGFQVGYLIYSFLHYYIHTRKAPRRLELLWHRHVQHHYQDPHRGYGVSTPLWDWVFGTLPGRDERK